jgi:hypothetical protein
MKAVGDSNNRLHRRGGARHHCRCRWAKDRSTKPKVGTIGMEHDSTSAACRWCAAAGTTGEWDPLAPCPGVDRGHRAIPRLGRLGSRGFISRSTSTSPNGRMISPMRPVVSIERYSHPAPGRHRRSRMADPAPGRVCKTGASHDPGRNASDELAARLVVCGGRVLRCSFGGALRGTRRPCRQGHPVYKARRG